MKGHPKGCSFHQSYISRCLDLYYAFYLFLLCVNKDIFAENLDIILEKRTRFNI